MGSTGVSGETRGGGWSLYEQGFFKPAVIKTNRYIYFERERDIALLEELQNFFQ